MYHFIRKPNIYIPDALHFITLHSGNNIYRETPNLSAFWKKKTVKLNVPLIIGLTLE